MKCLNPPRAVKEAAARLLQDYCPQLTAPTLIAALRCQRQSFFPLATIKIPLLLLTCRRSGAPGSPEERLG